MPYIHHSRVVGLESAPHKITVEIYTDAEGVNELMNGMLRAIPRVTTKSDLRIKGLPPKPKKPGDCGCGG